MNVTLNQQKINVQIKIINNKLVKQERECKYSCKLKTKTKTVIAVMMSRRQRLGNVKLINSKPMAFIPAMMTLKIS